ncbi:sulfur oxidation c-type cytochrome SoxA [Leisingera aquaemixtae]|jgi:sulfur-oxidizing protein SoxA|uniref:sulfur oxidation c-type cytochrome SoxA n=1 Tax=Leisingera TaxID=191028 RepID=UPI0011507811|nr:MULTISPECIES: sulfur oxidation c-type cytochrome SoxA [Leisingera]QDI76123.1 sulfur oxidation c-type cytochrome SoxA [Leisingera aquaemixtae]UWQ26204.1 sulfur oxidation c-type cytochrome SoxA [Leisingera aquaemixtae]UWQ47130.1 sulfur oxidation c-type cytochrome SoxA [Leisingera aquaemixtae]
MNKKAITAIAAVLALPMAAGAGPDDDKLVVNEDIEMITKAAAPAHVADVLDEVMSGWHFRSDETQALQMDDFENPAMVFVDQAQEAWDTADGSEGKSCASCHGDVAESMAGVRAVYPKWNEEAGEVRTLNMQINDCRENQMGAEKWKYSGGDMAAMEALISVQSRGLPVNVAIDGPVQATWEQGKELYYTRTGQLELSCANCHEDNYGNMIRADHLSQGQINGFPVYRLKNTKLNTAHARFKGCVRDTRAETYKPGSAEFVALELYVASRGNGLSVEAPSVRN